VGLRVGTAVNPDLLGTNEKYTQITAEQFSSVTAENAMKWAEVEAVRGTYTWEKADQIVAFAKKNKQLVRGHTLVRHNQLPIHGVGFQGHLSTQYGYPDLTNNLERFAALGQKVALTEVDVRTQTKPDAVNEPVNASLRTPRRATGPARSRRAWPSAPASRSRRGASATPTRGCPAGSPILSRAPLSSTTSS
jgi:GH35 family endo-1,4-beta-xylanase